MEVFVKRENWDGVFDQAAFEYWFHGFTSCVCCLNNSMP